MLIATVEAGHIPGTLRVAICQETMRIAEISAAGQTACVVRLPSSEERLHKTRPTGRPTRLLRGEGDRQVRWGRECNEWTLRTFVSRNRKNSRTSSFPDVPERQAVRFGLDSLPAPHNLLYLSAMIDSIAMRASEPDRELGGTSPPVDS